ncbi:MAG: O-antigen ligase family protein [Deltaproteobacteria bacterium]|nr:O-antigen ligase family protein [Deltaproteobacteria bacterium]
MTIPATAAAAHSPMPAGSVTRALLTFGTLGIAVGAAALVLAGVPTRWMVYVVGALFCALVVFSLQDKERFLYGVLVLSFQADVSLRFAYERAGSEGMVFPLTTFVGAALLGYCLIWRAPHDQPPFRWGGKLSVPILLFFAASVASLLRTSERFVGITHLILQAQLYFAYLLALNLIRSQPQLDRTVKLLFVAVAMQSAVYFIQSATGETFTLAGEVLAENPNLPRPGGTVATSPGGFAAFMLPILLIAAAYYLTGQRGPAGPRPAMVAAMGIVALVLTFTRAAWGAFGFGIVWLLLLSARRGALRLRRVGWVAAATLGAAIAFSPMVAARFAESTVSDAYEERAALMRMALRVIAAEPLTGVGTGAYEHAFKSYIDSELDTGWVYTVHNVYLLRTAETGILGGISLVVLLLAALIQALRLTRTTQAGTRALALGWSAGLLAFCWMMYWNILQGYTYNAQLWFLMGMAEAVELSQDSSRDGRDRQQVGNSRAAADNIRPNI